MPVDSNIEKFISRPTVLEPFEWSYVIASQV